MVITQLSFLIKIFLGWLELIQELNKKMIFLSFLLKKMFCIIDNSLINFWFIHDKCCGYSSKEKATSINSIFMKRQLGIIPISLSKYLVAERIEEEIFLTWNCVYPKSGVWKKVLMYRFVCSRCNDIECACIKKLLVCMLSSVFCPLNCFSIYKSFVQINIWI